MKKLVSMYSALVLVTLLATSCEETPEEAIVPAKPMPDGVALSAKFESNLNDLRQSFVMNATAGGQIKGASGAILSFDPYAFKTQAGTVASGDVTIELIEIYKKNDMLLSRKPTNGRKPDGSIATLVSGGQFYVNAKQNGEPLKPVNGYSLIVPVSNTGGADNDMKLFDGKEVCEGDDCKIVWEQMDRGVEVAKWQDTGGVYSVYYAFQNKFGWTNIDKWYSDPRPKTTIFVDLPDEYNNTNCSVYLSYDGEASALAQFDKYDKSKKLFTEHYGLIPIGLNVHFVVVSIVEGEWHYAIAEATITENHVQVIAELSSTTEADLVKMVEQLP